ncbi:hypothetical protein CPB84DRAFT_1789634 [Gymnopilus junonius]|uniref:Uncharacterized protein n=1 Tax=Gymnopilus junonius TaxID=109634 RepID=A0A9P5NFP6_GYMJU|nr:hypothetical protein CPB84DRAFT_1789634 [Gymnopilus junonius]
MLNTTIRLRTVALRLTVFMTCWLRTYHAVQAADIIVQDTDPQIVYQPSASWHSSSDSCSSCLNPGTGISYHEAIHPAVGPDADDLPPSSTDAAAGHSSSTPTASSAPMDAAVTSQSSPNGGSNSGSSSPGFSGKNRRRFTRRALKAREDLDDTGSQDPDVTLSFNFTGYAISIYSSQPLGAADVSTNSTPTNMNLTFSLDNQSMGDFKNVGSALSTGFLQNKSIFSRSNLDDTPHQLVIHVGQNSSFIFDYLVYSTNATTNSSSSNSTPSTSLAAQMPSQSIDPKSKKHDIATFAGAVGGSVGVLGLFALGLALSIIRRRRRAALRDRQDSESLHTEATDDSPHMEGPAPFMPRFFPDTVIPVDPPTYSAATNHNRSTLLARLTSSVYSDSTRSYADIPPSMPPPLDDDIILVPPPPPFPVAVASPPIVLPEGAAPPSILTSDAILAAVPSHNLDSVGTNRSNFALSPESVPLLQAVVLNTSDLPPLPLLGPLPPPPPRPDSRASIASSISYDIHGNPIISPEQEDVSYGRGR